MKKTILIVLLFLVSFSLVGCNEPSINDDININEIITTKELIEMEVGDYKGIPIDYDGIGDYSDLNFEMDNNDAITIDEGLITGIKPGIVNVTVIAKNNEDVKTSFTVYVNAEGYKRGVVRFNIPTTGMIIGTTFDLGITTLNMIGATSNDDFNFFIDDTSIASLSSDYKLTALKNGHTTLKAYQKDCPSNNGSTDIYVGLQSNDKTNSGEPDNTALILYFKDGDYTIDCSKDEQLIIEGAKNYQRYYYTTPNEKVLLISDTGKFMGVSEGVVQVRVVSKDSKEKINNLITVKVTGTRMRDNYIDTFVDIALAEEGYKEIFSTNRTKYGEWNHLFDEWCATFVSWCANNAGIPTDIIPRTVSVTEYRTWYTARDRFYLKENYKPQKGDLIIFNGAGASHVGIVVRSDDTMVYTIEGNTSDMVAQRQYNRNYVKITGYCHPDFDKVPNSK